MKIALVVHDFLEGVGHGRYCIELARRFSREHEVHVFANRFEKKADFDYRARPVPAWRFSALTSVLSFAPAAEKMLARENFDVIHAQGFSCRRADVITAHVCNAARYKQVPPRGLFKTIFPALVIPRERAFYAVNATRAVIAVSTVVQRELEREYGVYDAQVIYHGIDTKQFAPVSSAEALLWRRELGLRENTWTWTFAGEAAKGLKETIRALAEFPQAQLAVVSRSNLASFKSLAAQLGVSDRVLFHGAEQNNMPRWYQSSDVFVYPSTYDTFGMVIAEAMACGVPVIVDKRIGAAEWIIDGDNGFFCEPNNLVGVLKRIAAVDPQKFHAISTMARTTVLQHTWDECAARTLAVYERAMDSKRNTK